MQELPKLKVLYTWSIPHSGTPAYSCHIHVHHTLNFAQQLLIHSLNFFTLMWHSFKFFSPVPIDSWSECYSLSPFFVDTQEDKDPGFVERLITQIIRNVQLTVEDIHIRYEDNVSMHAYTLIASYM